jgi:uncharacterized protein YukE
VVLEQVDASTLQTKLGVLQMVTQSIGTVDQGWAGLGATQYQEGDANLAASRG